MGTNGGVKEEQAGRCHRGPAGRGGRQAVNSQRSGEFPQAQFTCAEDENGKGFPRGAAPWECNAQKPAYVNTVWGYGYKWRG